MPKIYSDIFGIYLEMFGSSLELKLLKVLWVGFVQSHQTLQSLYVCVFVFSVRVNTKRATGFPGPEVCLLSAALHWLACAPIRWVRTLISALIGQKRTGPTSVWTCSRYSVMLHFPTTRNQKMAEPEWLLFIYLFSFIIITFKIWLKSIVSS